MKSSFIYFIRKGRILLLYLQYTDLNMERILQSDQQRSMDIHIYIGLKIGIIQYSKVSSTVTLIVYNW